MGHHAKQANGGRSDKRDPIFIVGVPRSGTTLLAAMLGSHSRLDCGPETHFFRGSNPGMLAEAVADPDWPRKAADVLCSLTTFPEERRTHEDFGFSREDLELYLATREPSVPAMLEALTSQHASKMAKPQWIEKTPYHLQCLGQIRRHYPRAPIVKIVRDPRDVVSSLTRMPWTSDSPVANAYLVAKRDEASWRFFSQDTNSITVRYEDLLEDPAGMLEGVCRLIAVEFEQCMLRTSSAAQSMVGPGEWYKSRVGKPLDTSSVGRWRADLSPIEGHATELICAASLARYGYEAEARADRAIEIHPLTEKFIEQNEGTILDLAAQDTVIVDGPNPLKPIKGLVCKSIFLPDGENLGSTMALRMGKLIGLAWRCLLLKLTGATVRWLDLPSFDSTHKSQTGMLYRGILVCLGKRISLENLTSL